LLGVVCLIIAENGDDDVASVIFLMGACVLALCHLTTIGAAAFGFHRGEKTRWWGTATLPFAMMSFGVLMLGSAISLDELM